MPLMSSCDSGMHTPCASSASCAYTTSPPITGLLVSFPPVAEPPLALFALLLLLLLHAAMTNTATNRRARSRRGVVRDEAGVSTFPHGLCSREQPVTSGTSRAAAAM